LGVVPGAATEAQTTPNVYAAWSQIIGPYPPLKNPPDACAPVH